MVVVVDFWSKEMAVEKYIFGIQTHAYIEEYKGRSLSYTDYPNPAALGYMFQGGLQEVSVSPRPVRLRFAGGARGQLAKLVCRLRFPFLLPSPEQPGVGQPADRPALFAGPLRPARSPSSSR